MNSELGEHPWLRIQRRIYYTLEHLGFELLRCLGIQLGSKVNKLGIVILGNPDQAYLDQLSWELGSKLGLEIMHLGYLQLSGEEIQWDCYIFIPWVVRKLVQEFRISEQVGLLGVSSYKLSMLPPLNLFRFLQRFHLILGIANPWLRIALVTTLQNRIQKQLFQEVCLHEVGHLLGKHGYPMYG